MDLHYELRDAALRMENGAFLQEPELLISAAAEITTLRARIVELDSCESQRDVLSRVIPEYSSQLPKWMQEGIDTDLYRNRTLAENAVWALAKCAERIAELERERVELDARVAAMEPFMAMGAAHTPGAFGPACMDCGASMIGVERCQHCGGKH